MKDEQPLNIVLVCRRLTVEEEKILGRSNDPIYTLEKKWINNNDLRERAIYIPNLSSDLSEKHIERIINFGHEALDSSRSIAEILKLGDHSLWYYVRFSLFQRSRISFITAERINIYLNKIGFNGKVDLYAHSEPLQYLIEKDCNYIPSKLVKKSNLSLSYLLKYIFLFFWRAKLGLIRNMIKRTAAPNLIIANPYLVQDVIESRSGRIKKGDPHLQDLIDASLSDSNYQYLTQLRPPSLEANHKLSITDYLRPNAYGRKSIYFEPYLLLAFISSKRRKLNQQLEKSFEEIQRSLQSPAINANQRVLLNYLLSLKKTLKLAIWREAASEILFSKLNLKKIIAIDEHSLQNSTLFNVARSNQIKRIAIQHGAISKGNIAYRFNESDKNFQPWPELNLLRGSFNRDELLKNHFPASSLKVVGHMRTDSIPQLKDRIKERKLIVYATQPMPPADQELKESQLADFLRLCKHLADYELVIKPHPNESEIQKYRELAKGSQYPNLSVYEGELYFLLASSKILITYYSTVGLEAIYFDKEVISMDYLQRDYQSYIKSGIAHQVLDGEALLASCKEVLDGKRSINALKKEKFIEERAFKIDGLVCNRIMDAIDQL